MKYNKLIRDNIPEIILAKGGTPVTRIADDKEYWNKLKAKLREEVDEFIESEDVEEIADMMEVLDAICVHKGTDWFEIRDIQMKKADERGGFEKKIILEES